MKKTLRASFGTIMGAPVFLLLLTDWSNRMSSEPAWMFALGLSVFSMTIIGGVAFMGAYRFLKTVGLFKGHYYY